LRSYKHILITYNESRLFVNMWFTKEFTVFRCIQTKNHLVDAFIIFWREFRFNYLKHVQRYTNKYLWHVLYGVFYCENEREWTRMNENEREWTRMNIVSAWLTQEIIILASVFLLIAVVEQQCSHRHRVPSRPFDEESVVWCWLLVDGDVIGCMAYGLSTTQSSCQTSCRFLIKPWRLEQAFGPGYQAWSRAYVAHSLLSFLGREEFWFLLDGWESFVFQTHTTHIYTDTHTA